VSDARVVCPYCGNDSKTYNTYAMDEKVNDNGDGTIDFSQYWSCLACDTPFWAVWRVPVPETPISYLDDGLDEI
jgi:hypothetical protein